MKTLLKLLAFLTLGVMSQLLCNCSSDEGSPIEILDNLDEYGYSLDCSDPSKGYNIRTLPNTNVIIVSTQFVGEGPTRKMVVLSDFNTAISATECTYDGFCCECTTIDQAIQKIELEISDLVSDQRLSSL